MLSFATNKNNSISSSQNNKNAQAILFILIKDNWKTLLFIFLLAFMLRMIYLMFLLKSPFFDMATLDSEIHVQWAREIADGSLLNWTPFFRAPLYPTFLSLFYLFYWDTHTTFTIIRIAQFFMGSLSCVLLFLIGTRIHNKKVGILAGLIASFYWLFIYFEGEFLIPSFLIFLILAGFLFLIEAILTKKTSHLFVSGIIFGLAAITRPNILLFFPVLLVWLYLQFKKDCHFQKALVKCGLYTVALFIPILPVTSINYLAGHDLVLISSQAGMNFFIGNNQNSDGKSAHFPGVRSSWWGTYYDIKTIAENTLNQKLKPSEVSEYWFKRGLHFIWSHPKRAFRLLVAKLGYLLDYYEIANNQDIYFFSNLNGFLNWPMFISYWMLFPFAFAGALTNKRDRFFWLQIGFIFSYAISILLFFVCARFRLPLIPFYILLASAFIVQKLEALKERRLRLLQSDILILFILIIYFSSAAIINKPFSSNSVDKPSIGLDRLAALYRLKGENNKAESAWEKMTHWKWPYNAHAYGGLGYLYFEQYDFKKALQYFQKAIRLDKSMELDIKDYLLRNGEKGRELLSQLEESKPYGP